MNKEISQFKAGRRILFSTLVILLFSCKPKNEEQITRIQLIQDEINLDRINSDEDAIGEFGFVNIGNYDLEISKVETSCHCTEGISGFSKIGAGDTLKIQVQYDKHKLGYFYQEVKFHGNFENSPISGVFFGWVVE